MIQFSLAGVTFENRQDVIKEIIVAAGVTDLLLIREPDNEYDANAIRVEASGLKVGYVPSVISKDIAHKLAMGKYYPAYLLKINGWSVDSTVGLTVRFNLPEEK